jgi:hypothetical protein
MYRFNYYLRSLIGQVDGQQQLTQDNIDDIVAYKANRSRAHARRRRMRSIAAQNLENENILHIQNPSSSSSLAHSKRLNLIRETSAEFYHTSQSSISVGIAEKSVCETCRTRSKSDTALCL